MSDIDELPPAKKIKFEPGGEDINTDPDPDNNEETEKNNGKEGHPSASSGANFTTPDEVQKLREFQVLDEVNDEDSNEDSDSSDGKSEDLSEEEIERMLEEDLPEGFKGAPKPKERPYITRQKIVLEEKGVNQFEVLPLEWMAVRHCSGVTVYLHRASRVCTLAKPYFLGKGNARRHDIPISAIPCLAYRRALEEEEKQLVIDRKIAEQIRNGTWANNRPDVNNQQSNTTVQNTEQDKNEVRETITTKQINGDSESYNKKSEAITNNEKSPANIDNLNRNESETVPVEFDDKLKMNNDTVSIEKDQENVTSNDIRPIDNELSTTSNEKEPNAAHESSQDVSVDDQTNVNNDKVKCPFSGDIKDDDPRARPVVLPGGIVMPPPRVETVNTSWKTQHLTGEQVNDYCKKLFKFKTVNIMHFKRWADRRKYTKARKTLQYPTLPEGTKLITIPAPPAPPAGAAAADSWLAKKGKQSKRDWVMNMNGCSYLSVFHEYVRRALDKQPVYEFKQLENALTPYQATVLIGGMQYGVGLGSSKRQAKAAAARASIHILIPEMKDALAPPAPAAAPGDPAAPSDPAASAAPEPDFSFFDYVGIEDPRIQEFCTTTAEPSPHAILRTCLLRNFGAGDRHIHTEMKKLEYQKIELTMRVGKHSATVVCKNKKQAKQRASQAILQALHPHVRSWGSLLRLYGSRSVKSCKERKQEEQQVTLLQERAQHNRPNHAVLHKLRQEMGRLRARDAARPPRRTLLLPAGLPASASHLGRLQL